MVQGGSGLHIVNQSIFKYMCGNNVAAITPDISEIPDKEVRDILVQVRSTKECVALLKHAVLTENIYLTYVCRCYAPLPLLP